MSTEDEAEIEATLQGNERAFEGLMRRHHAAVHRISYRVTGSAADADDATQEAFIRAHKKLVQFRKGSSFLTWISRIAINAALDIIAKRRDTLPLERTVRVNDEKGSECDPEFKHPGPDPERSAMDAQTYQICSGALQVLTPMERTAFVLRHLEEFSMAEVASSLDLSVNAAKQAVFRAVGKLRKELRPVLRSAS